MTVPFVDFSHPWYSRWGRIFPIFQSPNAKNTQNFCKVFLGPIWTHIKKIGRSRKLIFRRWQRVKLYSLHDIRVIKTTTNTVFYATVTTDSPAHFALFRSRRAKFHLLEKIKSWAFMPMVNLLLANIYSFLNCVLAQIALKGPWHEMGQPSDFFTTSLFWYKKKF